MNNRGLTGQKIFAILFFLISILGFGTLILNLLHTDFRAERYFGHWDQYLGFLASFLINLVFLITAINLWQSTKKARSIAISASVVLFFFGILAVMIIAGNAATMGHNVSGSVIFSSIIILGPISLLIYYFVRKKKVD
ncbi:MAG: hypothetical protein AB1629_03730 [Candidatus Omnitrophota bacterium]